MLKNAERLEGGRVQSGQVGRVWIFIWCSVAFVAFRRWIFGCVEIEQAMKENDDKFDWNLEALLWMRSRPDSIKALMRRFPPSCLVKAKRDLCGLPSGEVGRVASYIEPDDEHPKGSVAVYSPYDITQIIRYQCHPDWLEVVGYWKDMDERLVDRILDET